ncbi:MAG: hypothetical protein ACFFD4_02235 [Candidatus Odinarchaeota archaeon]
MIGVDYLRNGQDREKWYFRAKLSAWVSRIGDICIMTTIACAFVTVVFFIFENKTGGEYPFAVLTYSLTFLFGAASFVMMLVLDFLFRQTPVTCEICRHKDGSGVKAAVSCFRCHKPMCLACAFYDPVENLWHCNKCG